MQQVQQANKVNPITAIQDTQGQKGPIATSVITKKYCSEGIRDPQDLRVLGIQDPQGKLVIPVHLIMDTPVSQALQVPTGFLRIPKN